MKKLLILMAVLALGCQGQPSTGGDENPPTQPDPDPEEQVAGIKFAKSYDLARSGQFLEVFSFMGQRDIIAVVDFQVSDVPSSGVFFMNLRVLNSQAAEHLTYWRAFTLDTEHADTIMHPIGRGSLEVTELRVSGGWGKAYLAIPIAGTSFTRNHLTGMFYAEAKLGQATDAKILTNMFEMVKD